VKMLREIYRQPAFRDLVEGEFLPGADRRTDAAILDFAREKGGTVFHAAGTCAIGPARNALAVTNARGAVHGVSGLYVADCSAMPRVPRANTNIPAVVVGMRIGRWLAGSASPQ